MGDEFDFEPMLRRALGKAFDEGLLQGREQGYEKGLREGYERGVTEAQVAVHRVLDDVTADNAVFTVDTAVRDMELSNRATDCLVRAGILNVGQLIEKTANDLLGIKYFGFKTLGEVEQTLHQHGYMLAE